MSSDRFYKDLMVALVDHDCPQISSLISILMVALVSLSNIKNHARFELTITWKVDL
jgi:hypothetical protein